MSSGAWHFSGAEEKKWKRTFVKVKKMKRNSPLNRNTQRVCPCTQNFFNFIPWMIPTYTYRAITSVTGHTSTGKAAIVAGTIRVFVTSICESLACVDVYLKAIWKKENFTGVLEI